MFDYAIVGGGLIGSACAKYVCQSVHGSQASVSVCLIGPKCPTQDERQPSSDRLAFGADDDEGRIVHCDCTPDPVLSRLARKSIERFRSIEQESGIQFYSPVGHMTVVGSTEQLPELRTYVDKMVANSCGRAEAVHPVQDRFPFLAGVPESCCGLLATSNAGHISPRRLVSAQLLLAERLGCEVVRDVVTAIRDGHGKDGGYELALRGGRPVTARRVLLAAGVCSTWPGLLPRGMQLDAEPQTQTTLLAEVAEESVRESGGRLAAMPCVAVRDFWRRRGDDGGDDGGAMLNSRLAPGLAYILPPIRYPDGRLYLKIGHGKLHDDPLPCSAHTIAEWYRGNAAAVGSHLGDVLGALMPGLKPLSLRLDSCVTLCTPTGKPYVGALPGSDGSSLFVATGGNGMSARSSDELGRLAAGLLVSGKWLSDAPRELFAPRCVPKKSKL